jgi:3-methylfumaryl-CoA hydratase
VTSELERYLGNSLTERDELSLAPARGMAALLDRSAEAIQRGEVLPWGWHWLYFHPTSRQSELASDGHSRRGDFLPAVPLPRRMWVGGKLRFESPLRLGEPIERESTITAIREKEGRTGRLIFVTVRHLIGSGGAPAIAEEQELVYRAAAQPGERRAGGPPPPDDCPWRDTVPTDPVFLFRFSALTFNGHRIHYDHPYATTVEGYPGLLVHGPLTALLLLDFAVRQSPGRRPGAFEYRAEGPLFGGEPVVLVGGPGPADGARVWAVAPDGRTAMRATIEWAS